MPQISLVIPAHNEEKYIASCLEHVIDCQNSSNSDSNGSKDDPALLARFSEIIVVDNNSSDKTVEIANQILMKNSLKSSEENLNQNTGLKFKIISEQKKGVVRARERGFRESTGDIIVFLDADTHMPKNWLPAVVREFQRDPKIVCVSGPWEYDDVSIFKKVLVNIYWYLIAMPTYFLVGYMGVSGNLAIRREILEKMGGLNTDIEFYGDDTDTTRRASKFGKVKFTPAVTMYSSGRRLAGQGLINTTLTYTLNFLSQIFIKKSVTKNYKDYR